MRYNPVTQADGTMTVTVGGQLGDGCSSQTYLSLLDHATYTAGAVRAIWKELGGSIQGKDVLAPTPKNAKVLARAFSPDLAEIIRDINKYSNNTMAQQLFLSLGAVLRTQAQEQLLGHGVVTVFVDVADDFRQVRRESPVSYTHLTLPTILLV